MKHWTKQRQIWLNTPFVYWRHGPVTSAYYCCTSNEMVNGYGTMPINLKRSIVVEIVYCSIARGMVFLLSCGLAFPVVWRNVANKRSPREKKRHYVSQSIIMFHSTWWDIVKLLSGTSLTLLCGTEALVMPSVSFYCEETTRLGVGGGECFVLWIICWDLVPLCCGCAVARKSGMALEEIKDWVNVLRIGRLTLGMKWHLDE